MWLLILWSLVLFWKKLTQVWIWKSLAIEAPWQISWGIVGWGVQCLWEIRKSVSNRNWDGNEVCTENEWLQRIPSLKLKARPPKFSGWKMNFLLERPSFRGELLVSFHGEYIFTSHKIGSFLKPKNHWKFNASQLIPKEINKTACWRSDLIFRALFEPVIWQLIYVLVC